MRENRTYGSEGGGSNSIGPIGSNLRNWPRQKDGKLLIQNGLHQDTFEKKELPDEHGIVCCIGDGNDPRQRD